MRVLAFCLIVVAIIAAILDAEWGGFTPVVWLLLAVAFILGVICNELAQVIDRLDSRGSKNNSYARTALDEPMTRSAEPAAVGEASVETTAAVAAVTEGEAPALALVESASEAAAPAPEPAEPEGAAPAAPSPFEVEIYCVKCREKRMIRDPETVELANGRLAYRGVCPVCGTKVTRIRKMA